MQTQNYLGKDQENLPQQPKIDICCTNITYSVKVQEKSNNKLPFCSKFTEKTILKNISAIFKAGQVSAIMGASGAGKTSLLNILACRINITDQQGKLYANQTQYNYQNFGDFANYVMQKDNLMQTLTVRQTLKFATDLKLNLGDQEKAKTIQSLCKKLKLQNCMDVLVGGILIKGISGGEKKRTSIAFQLITHPAVILLDEPTSGLDSLTSFIIVRYLGELAREFGKTVILTIHQPNSEIFGLFDKLLLMVEGKLIYQGDADSASKYFGDNFSLNCPELYNPADYFISIMHHQDQYNRSLFDNYYESYDNTIANSITQQIQSRNKEGLCKREINISFQKSFSTLLGRDFINIIRNPIMVKSRIFQTFVLFIYIGGLYCQIGSDYTNITTWTSLTGFMFFIAMNGVFFALTPISLVFPLERSVFLKQENAKLYGVSTYFLSRNAIEIPYTLIFPMIQSLILYWFVGLSSTASQFFTFYLIIYNLNFIGSSLGLFVGSVIKDPKSIGITITITLLPLIVFSGYFKNSNNLPNWVGWIQYMSPFKYGLSALVQNQVLYHTPSLVGFMNFDVSLWGSIGCLFAMGIGLRFLSWFFLWFNRQRMQ